MNQMLRNSKTRMLIKQVFLMLFCLDLALSLSLGSLSRILQQEKQHDTMESSWPSQQIETEEGDVLKKRCNTFPCMYNHIATKAGEAERKGTLFNFISSCMGNPLCDPGKRRKRSMIPAAFFRVLPQTNKVRD